MNAKLRGFGRGIGIGLVPVFVFGQAVIWTTGLVIGVNQALVGERIQPAITKIETVSVSLSEEAPFDFLAGLYGFLGEMAETVAVLGMKFGYAYPGIGEPLAYILPLAISVAAGVWGVKLIGRVLGSVGGAA